MQRRKILAFLFPLIAWCSFLAVGVPPASAQFKAWAVAKFPETPWGLGMDSEGNIYTTLIRTGEVVMIKDDGNYAHIAWVPSKEESGNGGVLGGLDLDKANNIYVAYKASSKYDQEDLDNPAHPSCRDATVTRSGVYKIDAKTRSVTGLATRADGWPFCWPHDLAVDLQGNVYVADITYPAIWRISPDGKKVALWSAHPLLGWSPNPYSGFALGISALAIDHQQKSIYAVTMGNPMVLRIPVKEDGSAGEPHILKPGGYSVLDGIELDGKGNIYVSEVLRNEIWVLSPDGSQRSLIASRANAPLDNNASLLLKGDLLCTANFGLTHQNPQDADRTVVCMKGFTLPK